MDSVHLQQLDTNTKAELPINDFGPKSYRSVLCIGAKASTIKKEMLDNQYFCIDLLELAQASNLLKRAVEENEILPDGIIVDIDLDSKSLNNFLHVLKKSAKLRAIPFFLFTDDINYIDGEKYFSNPLIDDVYGKNSDIKKMCDRISFLIKFKVMQNNADGKSTVQVIHADDEFDFNYFMKRVGDVVISGILLVLLMPLFTIIALAIIIESRGPIVYSSERAGRGFRVFKFYKFRSMYVGADAQIKNLEHLNQYVKEEGKDAKFFKISNDPRITKVGAFLRNTSIDELPQLFNIFKGDMSIVGNRPLPLYEANAVTTDDWSKRFLAPAGLTGLWQVTKRGKKDMSVDERLDLDVTYANKWSFLSDINIIMKTPGALRQKDNV